MKFDALILADAATVVGEKFFIHGGGLTRYEVPGLPAQIPLSVLIRFLVEDGDLDQEKRLTLTLLGPQGIPNVAPVEIGAVYTTPEAGTVVEGQQQFLQIALSIPAVAVREGLYKVELRLDGKLAKRVPFPVVVNPGLAAVSTAPDPINGTPPSKPKAKRPPPPPQKAKRQRR